MSSLGNTLDVGRPMTTPPELYDDIVVTPQLDLNMITISGNISISGALPFIIQQGTPAAITLPVEDNDNEGVVFVETRLVLHPSPPLFNQSTYIYSISEDSSNLFLGPFTVIDPNGDSISTPTTNTSLFRVLTHISDGGQPGPYSYFDILILVQLNYEQQSTFFFEMTVIDSVSSTLSSTALVTVNVLPVNEFSPVFLVDQ